MPAVERFAPNFEDGTVTIAWSGQDPIILRRPKVGEYRHLVGLHDAARAAVTVLADEAGNVSDAAMLGTDEEPGPFLLLYPEVFRTLGGVDVTPGDLPLWASAAQLFMDLRAHWREIPLDLGSRALPTSAG